MATNELSIKLLINKKTGKLCFAEAGSDVVEFLTSLLSLPVGTVTSLLAKENMAGSVGTLLGSAEKLGAKYNSKELNLIPTLDPATLSRLEQLLGVQVKGNGQVFMCAGQSRGTYTSMHFNCPYVSTTCGSSCPSCGKPMNDGMTITTGNRTNDSPVAGVAAATPTYTLKDDLSMTPAASMSVITLLSQCGVKDLSVLQEKTVKIGKEEVILLRVFEC
jgi:hypothetical protein